MKQNKSLFMNIFLIFSIVYYCWYRFIRERLPRDIPFNLSLWSLFLLIYILIILVIILKQLIKPNINKEYYNFILAINTLFKPIYNLDALIRKQKIIIYISNRIAFLSIYETSLNQFIYYFLWYFVPKIVLILLFIYDVFYINQINMFYTFIFLNIIPLIICYIIHIIKNNMADYISFLEKWYEVKIISTHKDANSDFANLLKPDGIDDFTIRTFLNHQTMTNNECVYKCSITWDVVEKYYPWKDFEISSISELSINQKTFIEKDFYELMPILINYYNFYNCYEFTLRKFFHKIKCIKIAIYILYLFTWAYILLISAHTFHFTELDTNFLTTFQDIFEPFSNLILNISHET